MKDFHLSSWWPLLPPHLTRASHQYISSPLILLTILSRRSPQWEFIIFNILLRMNYNWQVFMESLQVVLYEEYTAFPNTLPVLSETLVTVLKKKKKQSLHHPTRQQSALPQSFPDEHFFEHHFTHTTTGSSFKGYTHKM